MKIEITKEYQHPPAAIAFMSRALIPSRGLTKNGTFPRITLRWTGMRFDAGSLAACKQATGLSGDDEVSVLHPHIIGMRLQMALLTHPDYPLPIWHAVQIRNQLVRHRHIDPRQAYAMETAIGEHRVFDKGIEVDLLTRLLCGSDCCWESKITYYYRGHFGLTGTPRPKEKSPDLAHAKLMVHLSMPSAGGWRFGHLTGDYNGIHNWSWYARLFGFRGALLHPQRSAGMCMARLTEPLSVAQSLALWIKGPVLYDTDVSLTALTTERGTTFGLIPDADGRAALIGCWESC